MPFLKSITSVSSGHCDYSPRIPKYLFTPLVTIRYFTSFISSHGQHDVLARTLAFLPLMNGKQANERAVSCFESPIVLFYNILFSVQEYGLSAILHLYVLAQTSSHHLFQLLTESTSLIVCLCFHTAT